MDNCRTQLMGNFRLVTVGLAMVLAAGNAFPLGERSNPRGVGMGRTYIATAKGLNGAGMNPANLALDSAAVFTIGVAPIGFNLGGDVLGYDVYRLYFSGIETAEGIGPRHLTEADKEIILSRFEDEMGSSYANIDARLLGIAVRLPGAGVLAFTVTDYAGATFIYSEDFARFLFYGNPLGSDYDFSGTRLSATWFRAYGVSFGSVVAEGKSSWLSIGGSAKFVHGFAHYEVLRSDTRLQTSDYGVLNAKIDFLARLSESSTLYATGFDLFPVPVGTGWGFDLGIGVGFSRSVSFGLSATDIGSIVWTNEVQEIYTDTTLVVSNPFDPAQQEAVLDAISGVQRREVESFRTVLPTTIRAGMAIEMHETPLFEELTGELLLGIDYHQPLYEVPGRSTVPRFSAGAEYVPVPWLPLRAGVSVGGNAGLNIAVGFGVRTGFLSIDVASDNAGWLFAPSRSSFGSLSVGASLRF